MSSGFSGETLSQVNRGRLIVFGGLILVILLFYLSYLFNLQVVKGGEYQRRARQVSRQIALVPSQRGKIYDRNRGTPLVTNVDSFSISLIPAEVPPDQFDILFQRLEQELRIKAEDIRQKIPPRLYHSYKPIELINGAGLPEITRIAEKIEMYPGVVWSSKPIRKYNADGSISHVLGFVGNITHKELQVLYNEGYGFNSVLGKSGVEKYYDMTLRGKDGKRYRTVDVRGRDVGGASSEIIEPPELGKDIILTRDQNIQTLAEKALADHIGSAIVLKPATGEILAMVSYPWYDPAQFYGKSKDTVFKKLSLDENFPFLNRTIQSSYAPASCFKIIMSAAVLNEEDTRPPEETVTCRGNLRLGDRIFRCHKRSGHGPLDLPHAFSESCDVYYYTLGLEDLGIRKISRYAREFGLGQSTEIDLPSEVHGNVPTPEWKDKVYHTPWVGGDTVNTSIGQGFLAATPLQMANSVAMVLNDGRIYKPHLLKSVQDPISGQIIRDVKPEILHESSMDKDVFAKIRRYMRMVVSEGTARYVITTPAVPVAGKTGTGEVGIEDHFHSWFVSFAPYNAPPEDQVVVVAMAEAVNEWDSWAPKAVDMIIHGIFEEQSYEEVVDSLNPWYLRW